MRPDYLYEIFFPFSQSGLQNLQANLFSQITLLKFDRFDRNRNHGFPHFLFQLVDILMKCELCFQNVLEMHFSFLNLIITTKMVMDILYGKVVYTFNTAMNKIPPHDLRHSYNRIRIALLQHKFY